MSEVDICNDALGYIGKQTINSLNDPEPAARQCNRLFPRVMRELQARYDWGHNLTVSDISKRTDSSNLPEFKYAHKLPADYLRFSGLTHVEGSSNDTLDATFSSSNGDVTSRSAYSIRAKLLRSAPVAMMIAHGFVHTNFTPIRFVYHRYVRELDNVPELFRMALVTQLAARLVFPMTRDTKLTAKIQEMASEAILFAQSNEDQDDYTETPEGSSFQDARY